MAENDEEIIPLDLNEILAIDLFEALLSSESFPATAKRELAAWLRTQDALDYDQYQLAVSRIKHLEKQS